MEIIPAKTILSGYLEQGWFGVHYNMNLYRGCSHGCIYCDSRSACYQIQDFDRVKAKENALVLLDRELKAKRRKGAVLTGSMSDPYNPWEEEQKLTQGALRLLLRHGYGVVVITKSDLAARDTGLFTSIAAYAPVAVNFTITTADDALCQRIERNVCPTSKRLEAIRVLSEAGISCGITLMPLLPFLNDNSHNLKQVVALSAQAGAKWIATYGGLGVTMREGQREYFYEMLDQEFPGIRQRYVQRYGFKYHCPVPDASLGALLRAECKRHGLLFRQADIDHLIHAPYTGEQLTFL